MISVLVATPCLDQKIDAYYVHSLSESVKLGLKYNIDIKAVFLANESVLPMARNELIWIGYNEKYDQMIFIDDDQYWNPQCLIDMILSPKDVIALPVVNKSDIKEGYNIFPLRPLEIDPEDSYLVADRVGTGFLKLSKRVIVDLWESNTELFFRNKNLRNVCEYTYVNGVFTGEDITLSKKVKELGYTIWVNPKATVSHIGNKMYQGNFSNFINEKN